MQKNRKKHKISCTKGQLFSFQGQQNIFAVHFRMTKLPLINLQIIIRFPRKDDFTLTFKTIVKRNEKQNSQYTL